MRLENALVDQGFEDEVIIHSALPDIDVEVVRRNPADQGKGTLLLHRRPAHEYDHRRAASVPRVYWASTVDMIRRLTTPAPAWRDTLGLAA